MTQLTRRVATLESKVDNWDRQIATLESKVDNRDRQIATLESKVDYRDHQIATLERKVDSMDQADEYFSEVIMKVQTYTSIGRYASQSESK